MTSTPGFDALARSMEVLQGAQRRILEALVEGSRPDATQLALPASEYADAVRRLVEAGMIEFTSADAPIALTTKGSQAAAIVRQLTTDERAPTC